MADYQEYKSYGAYLGRILIIIVALVALGFAIWFIIGLARGDDEPAAQNQTENSEVATEENNGNDPVNEPAPVEGDENTDEQPAEEQPAGDEDNENTPAVEDDEPEPTPAPVEDENDATPATGGEGRALSTNSDDLPETGMGSNLAMLMATPVIIFAGVKYVQSRHNLSKV